MFINEILVKGHYDLKSSDTITYALDKMSELHTAQLPVVDEKDFLGIITENHLLSAHEPEKTVGSLMISLQFLYLKAEQHIYEALQYISAYQLEILPIVDKNNYYLGIITLNDLVNQLNITLGNNVSGAIIILELEQKDISFAQIAHIIESEDIKILNMSANDIPDSTKTLLTIKVNKQNIASLIASLWRYNYIVKATFDDVKQDSEIQERYDILMNYLNI
ncbi:CBS domain-containing protein [Sphingobacterium sp. UT-1RO-CII-1]|uniref:CBS domain-containing protein n=1 Tax=Sphingobacterium sp. UT-1RO-CII-1 TaxID=2995225 RepID=UPI00227BA29B|nr:CBS domain-containing protein [Sphingobacterium sp. UT-1RO-CII-1]MCY4779564.1 CBS domain-containing protein [Sphingobacterium sp. UT-1RO-CII-1]